MVFIEIDMVISLRLLSTDHRGGLFGQAGSGRLPILLQPKDGDDGTSGTVHSRHIDAIWVP